MLVGQAPISAYRTLDLPAVPELTSLAHGPLSAPADRAPGHGGVACDRDGLARFRPDRKPDGPACWDAKASLEKRSRTPPWPVGSSAQRGWPTRGLGRERSRSGVPRTAPARAWLVPLRRDARADDAGRLVGRSSATILAILDAARAAGGRVGSARGMDHLRRRDEPGWVIVSQLADPQWTARWIGLDGQGNAARQDSAGLPKGREPGGWQCFEVPAPGRWTLRLEYDARDVAEGAAISTVAWLSWMLAAVFTAFQSLARSIRAGATSDRGIT